jgi:hypothetical protein
MRMMRQATSIVVNVHRDVEPLYEDLDVKTTSRLLAPTAGSLANNNLIIPLDTWKRSQQSYRGTT